MTPIFPDGPGSFPHGIIEDSLVSYSITEQLDEGDPVPYWWCGEIRRIIEKEIHDKSGVNT
jgi:hypothetical protein